MIFHGKILKGGWNCPSALIAARTTLYPPSICCQRCILPVAYMCTDFHRITIVIPVSLTLNTRSGGFGCSSYCLRDFEGFARIFLFEIRCRFSGVTAFLWRTNRGSLERQNVLMTYKKIMFCSPCRRYEPNGRLIRFLKLTDKPFASSHFTSSHKTFRQQIICTLPAPPPNETLTTVLHPSFWKCVLIFQSLKCCARYFEVFWGYEAPPPSFFILIVLIAFLLPLSIVFLNYAAVFSVSFMSFWNTQHDATMLWKPYSRPGPNMGQLWRLRMPANITSWKLRRLCTFTEDTTRPFHEHCFGIRIITKM